MLHMLLECGANILQLISEKASSILRGSAAHHRSYRTTPDCCTPATSTFSSSNHPVKTFEKGLIVSSAFVPCLDKPVCAFDRFVNREPEGQLTRWIQRLQEYDFEIIGKEPLTGMPMPSLEDPVKRSRTLHEMQRKFRNGNRHFLESFNN
ncbi:hypothetical protein AVEN_179097-1 [Araneus ventricosus]|uniref:Uncharacterized protein n=1 Tax=Araneus ventricosus TaxID=182803 RepID=A0A4Y2F6Y5_ARAVE|nr:hypothetical protein AVEN_179097-1 [Araneus ventricosus]